MFNDLSKLWIPPERLTLSEWSERHLVLSSEYSSRSGPIKLFEYQREIFDSFTDPSVKEIVLMCSTQMVKSLFIQAITGYVIANDPLPIMIIQPKDDAAKKFSKRRIVPMLRDSPILANKVKESGAGHDTTIQEKSFPGGSLSILGAGSPTNLASASIAILLLDEVDKFDANVGGHGDPISQAKARLSTYGSRAKLVMVCTPTNEHSSRIADAYQNSDQRQAFVKCHACGHSQVLRFTPNVKFDKEGSNKKRAESAYYECEKCQAHWNDLQRLKACNQIEWRAQQPFAGVAGFHISHLYSPWHKLSDIVLEHLLAGNSWEKRVTFTNNTLAELWKVDGQSPEHERLFARREKYPFATRIEEEPVIPMRASFLTASCDVQGNPARLEVEVRAWGRGKESWSIGYYVIQVLGADGKTPLPTTDPLVWAELDKLLQRDWQHESGATMPILLMAVDTGYNAATVYDFCLRHIQPSFNMAAGAGGMRVRSPRTVVPVKGGDDALKIIQQVSSENAAKKRQNIRIVTVGTHRAKSEIYDSLRNIKPSETEPVAGCIHFPEYSLDYFKGLCSEHRIVKANGDHEWQRIPNQRNEPLDLAVYNRAAATIVGIDWMSEQHWLHLESGLNKQAAPVQPTEPTITTEPKRTLPIPPLIQRPQRRVIGRFI